MVDSNFFIQAHRVNYPLDIAHSFWKQVKTLADSGSIVSIDKVKKEIYDNNDALKNWCKENLPEAFFKETGPVMESYQKVTGWAISKSDQYKPGALAEFLDADEADAFIVAYALADPANRIVVTQEISEPNSKKKVKIPDACLALNVKYLNTIEMFRQLGVTF